MKRTRAEAFNEWMRLYTEEPEQFGREWQTVAAFMLEQAAGDTPSYGGQCDAFLAKLEAGE